MEAISKAHPAHMLELRILNISKYHIPGYFPKKLDFIGKKMYHPKR